MPRRGKRHQSPLPGFKRIPVRNQERIERETRHRIKAVEEKLFAAKERMGWKNDRLGLNAARAGFSLAVELALDERGIAHIYQRQSIRRHALPLLEIGYIGAVMEDPQNARSQKIQAKISERKRKLQNALGESAVFEANQFMELVKMNCDYIRQKFPNTLIGEELELHERRMRKIMRMENGKTRPIKAKKKKKRKKRPPEEDEDGY